MRDRDRATRARQQDEQAPRAHPGVAEDAPGDRIDLAEIVQQPAVGPERAELPCERGEVETVEERHQPCRGSGGAARHRSEEHTSELQSPCNLVCRLLLEKKKNKHISI